MFLKLKAALSASFCWSPSERTNFRGFFLRTYRSLSLRVSRKILKKVKQTRIDLRNIFHIYELWQELQICPFTGEQRPYNRIVTDIAFNHDNFEALRDQLESRTVNIDGRDETFHVPKNCRTLQETDIKTKGSEFFSLDRLCTFLSSSGGPFAIGIRDHVTQHFSDSLSDAPLASSNFRAFWDKCSDLAKKAIADDLVRNEHEDVSFLNEELLKVDEGFLAISRFVSVLINVDCLAETHGDGSLDGTLYLFCEELAMTEYLYSNDIGLDQVPKANLPDPIVRTDAHELMEKAIAESALCKLKEKHDFNHPVPEWSAAYLQKAFPFDFLTGDADPFQRRPSPFKISSPSDKIAFLRHLAQIHALASNEIFQFTVLSLIRKAEACKGSKAFVLNADFARFPTKQQLIDEPERADELCRYIMRFGYNIINSRAYWSNIRREQILIKRYLLEEGVDRRPVTMAAFKTFAFPYRDAYYFHRLVSQPSFVDVPAAKAIAAVDNPNVIAYVGTLISE